MSHSSDRLRVLVVDDEPLGRDRVCMFVSARKDLEIIGECSDGYTAVRAIRQQEPDLVFLDVQMPGLDGIGVVREIGPDQMPPVIFVTAYDEYALEAFQIHALDYLLKPFRSDRFNEAVDRVVRMIKDGESRARAGLDSLVADRKYVDRILVKGSRKAAFVRADRIDWIEAAGNYLKLHVGERTHLIRQTMNNLERQLDPGEFVRIHRSAIVNLNSVSELQRTENGDYEILLTGGERLKLSRGYRRGLDRFDPMASDFAR